MNNLMPDNLTDRYNKLSGSKARLLVDKREKRRHLRLLQKDIDNHVKARTVFQEVGKLTQDKFKRRVESLVTLAIQSVYDRNYTFELRFETKQNQITATPIIKEGDKELNPKDEMGGGIIDIISFALRVVLWSLETPRSRNVFILDEPFKWTGALIGKAGAVLKRLSKELHFQVIVISHDDELINICDRVWRITHDGTKSTTNLIKGKEIKRR